MKLGQWMQGWRESGSRNGDREPATPTAAYTNAAATLRHVLNLLPVRPAHPAEPELGENPERLETLFAEAEHAGAILGVPHLEHSAGQMRLLWRSVRDGTLTVDPAILPTMRTCVMYLLDHLTSERPFPDTSAEVDAWNAAYQDAMARQRPSPVPDPAAAAPPTPVTQADEAPTDRDETPVATAEVPTPAQEETAGAAFPTRATEPRHVLASLELPPVSTPVHHPPPTPGALDPDELERLLLARCASAAAAPAAP